MPISRTKTRGVPLSKAGHPDFIILYTLITCSLPKFRVSRSRGGLACRLHHPSRPLPSATCATSPRVLCAPNRLFLCLPGLTASLSGESTFYSVGGTNGKGVLQIVGVRYGFADIWHPMNGLGGGTCPGLQAQSCAAEITVATNMRTYTGGWCVVTNGEGDWDVFRVLVIYLSCCKKKSAPIPIVHYSE